MEEKPKEFALGDPCPSCGSKDVTAVPGVPVKDGKLLFKCRCGYATRLDEKEVAGRF